jgi:nucleoside-diphosphate-sugar epimerase
MVVEAALDDADALREACAAVGTVSHLASMMPSAATKAVLPEAWRQVNVEGTVRLARVALAAGVRRFVFVSSTAAMGSPTEPEVDEDTPCRPASPYEVTKRAAEQELLRLQAQEGLPVVILRPSLVAGAGQRGGVLLKLFRLCRRGLFPVVGPQLEAAKPLISAHDLVQALLLAAERGREGRIYLVHSGERHTLRTILEAAGRLVGRERPWITVPLPLVRAASIASTPVFRALSREPPLSPERLALFLADRRISIERARRELGYVPLHRDVGAMLRETYEGYRATGQL